MSYSKCLPRVEPGLILPSSTYHYDQLCLEDLPSAIKVRKTSHHAHDIQSVVLAARRQSENHDQNEATRLLTRVIARSQEFLHLGSHIVLFPLTFVTRNRWSRGIPLSLMATPSSSWRYHSRAVAESNNLRQTRSQFLIKLHLGERLKIVESDPVQCLLEL